MYLPMTSIQDAWGVNTLDDRSDTTIKPVRRCHNNNQVRIIPAPAPTNAPSPASMTTSVNEPVYVPVVPKVLKQTPKEEQQLVGLLTLLMIFVLLDKLLTIWKQS
jgi:hypothetical protein